MYSWQLHCFQWFCRVFLLFWFMQFAEKDPQPSIPSPSEGTLAPSIEGGNSASYMMEFRVEDITNDQISLNSVPFHN